MRVLIVDDHSLLRKGVGQPHGSVLEDYGGDRKLNLAGPPRGHTVMLDSWNDLGTVENLFFTE